MIIDLIENLHKYKSLFTGIQSILKFKDDTKLSTLATKENYEEIVLIPITSLAVLEAFDPSVLEAHRTLMDIHITLKGTDVIAYADLATEAIVFKEYDEVNDYLLATSDRIKKVTVPEGYFCIIPNHFAHMALYEGHANVKKVVVKINA